MDLEKSIELMKRYNSCPKCGNDKIGNGEGTLNIEDEMFYRSCKCGWEIKTNEDGKIYPLDY